MKSLLRKLNRFRAAQARIITPHHQHILLNLKLLLNTMLTMLRDNILEYNMICSDHVRAYRWDYSKRYKRLVARVGNRTCISFMATSTKGNPFFDSLFRANRESFMDIAVILSITGRFITRTFYHIRTNR